MMPSDLNTLGGRIAFARKALDLTQSELGKLAGVGQSSIALLENGSTKAPKQALELANALQVPLEWLMHGECTNQGESNKDPVLEPEKECSSLASRLIMRREQLGLTQTQLADKSGLSQTTIANLEAGHSKGTKRILELAQSLHVTPEWLLYGGNLNLASGEALRLDFAVQSKEQQVEQMMSRFANLQVFSQTASPRKTTKAAITQLPIIEWHDKALNTPKEAYLSHLKRGYARCPFDHSQTSFWMRVPTDVMEPYYFENDLILVDPELIAAPGDDIVILAPGGEPGFGRLRHTINKQYIEILNPSYPDRMYELERDSQVVGVVNGMIREPRARK